MSLNDRDKLNRIEELKGKLFSKNYQMRAEHRDRLIRPKREDVPDVWQDGNDSNANPTSYQNKFSMKSSVFKNFFIFSLFFLGLSLLYASYVLFIGNNTVSNDNIDISILGNNFTAGGEDLSLVVSVTNKNSSSLDLVDLVVEYPKSSSNAQAGVTRLRESLGVIPAGAIRNENFKLVLFGEQGSIRNIKVFLEYRVQGSNGIFVKEKSYEVTISSTPLNISVDIPAEISPNQDITLNIKVTLNGRETASKILLKINYPVGFKFTSSLPAPSLGNNVWSLGDLAPGAERKIALTGRMLDVSDGEEKIFHISSGSQSVSDKSAIDVVFNSLSHTVLIKKPFIEANLFVNGVYQRDYATNAKTPINAEIRWINNLDTKVNDLQIRAKISGNAINRKTINSIQGFYDSSTDTITWDKNSKNGFNEINPGDSGAASFSFSSVSLFGAENGILSDPSIKIEISISGRQSVSGYSTVDLNNSDTSIVRIISDVGFAAKALHYTGPFVNTGPVPPKVGKETSYTVVWSISNTANSVSKGVVRSSLPSWIKFVGSISPTTEDLTYNASTKEIIWNVGRIPKGTGITTTARSVSFQVAFTPSLSQLLTIPIIINDAILTGHDDFANVDIRVSKISLRTELDSDPAFPGNGGTVVE